MKIIGVAIILFFISDLALAAEKTAKPTCLTSKCHAQLLAKIPEGSMRHSPLKAKGCNICHLTKPGLSAVQQSKLPPKHPILKNQTISEINHTCLICHDTQKENLEELKVHHDAIDNGCTSCHNPHSSKNKNLLKFNKYSQEFCFSCHEEMQSEIESATNTHEGMSEKKACLGCHDPHYSEEKHLLKKPVSSLCADCHSETPSQDDPVKHDPVEKGKCNACHSPHASNYKFLLLKNLNTEFHVPFDEKEYALCFKCHKSELAKLPNTTKETKFRNGTKNLHFFHVQEVKKNINCIVCHEIHTSQQPKLIREQFTYKGTKLPQKFKLTHTGGNCTNVCHGTKNYDRITEVINTKGR